MPGKNRVEPGAGNVLGLIGGTPLVRIEKIGGPDSADVLAKLESFNPAGCVKERIALSMIEAAEKEKLLKPGGAVIEPTSGNTGIGLAVVCAVRGYRCVLTMPDTMSMERIKMLEFFGAEVVLTPGAEGMTGAVEKAEELLGEFPSSYMPQQFRNPANPAAHRETTGPEIFSRTGGKVDAFVAGVGTGGTVTGAGGYLKDRNPDIRIIAVEPAESAVLSGGKAGPHRIQGIGAGFVPEVLDVPLIDAVITVSDEDAFEMSKLLARREGIFCGISSGAAMCGALEAARDLGPGKTVVTIFPDSGDRYLSMAEMF